MFAAVVTWLPLVAAITDPEVGVDFLRLLHSKQEMEFLAPIRPGDRISAQARIDKIEAVSSGESLVLEIMGANQDGIAVTQIRFSALIRMGRRSFLRNETSVEREQSRDAAMRVSELVDLDQTSRYAEASGDRNPIHVDPAVAKMAGLPEVIVHGLCTMAFACRAIIDSTCGSDPMRLNRLAAEFSRPVFPGDSITTAVWPVGARDERRIYAFETVDRENVAVIRYGVAEVLL
jgi:acyl dehydratase